MKIEVQLHTVLQRQTPFGLQRCIDLEMPPGSTLLDLLHILELELDPEQVLLVVNSKVVDENYILTEGEQVSLIPAMSGGVETQFPQIERFCGRGYLTISGNHNPNSSLAGLP